MTETAQPTGTPAATQKLNQVALWAMITGVAGLTVGWMIPLPFSLAAVILGHIGLSQLKRGMGTGRGYAVAGLATGYTGIAIAILFIGLVLLAFATLGVEGVMSILESQGLMDSGMMWDDFDSGMMNP